MLWPYTFIIWNSVEWIETEEGYIGKPRFTILRVVTHAHRNVISKNIDVRYSQRAQKEREFI